MFMLKSKGGKRIGAGRPKSENQTKTISFRVRFEWVDIIKELVKAKVLELKKNS